jgi:hypothetical protein
MLGINARKTEPIRSFETSILTRAIRRHNPEDGILQGTATGCRLDRRRAGFSRHHIALIGYGVHPVSHLRRTGGEGDPNLNQCRRLP